MAMIAGLRGGRVVALMVALAALHVAPAAAVAHRGDGVFTLAVGEWLSGADVAMLPDSTVVASDRRLNPLGGRSTLPEGLAGAFEAAPDGSLLSIGPDHRITRWTAAAGVSVVAGTGVAGFSGDGGPAAQAQVNTTPPAEEGAIFDEGEVWPIGIVALPDGGFAFTDAGNHRVRAVDGQGIIRTVAGGTARQFFDLVGLAQVPAGGYLVTEAVGGRLRRIWPDGRIETVARLDYAYDVVVSGNGAAVVSQIEKHGDLWRLPPGSRTFTPYLRAERPGETFDFAGREVLGEGLALDPQGGLLVVGPDSRRETRPEWRLSYLPNCPTPWSLAALRDTRIDRRGVSAVIETTQAGTATIEVLQRRTVVARVSRPVAAGHSTLRAVGRLRAEWYDVRLRLESATGVTARDRVPVHGARSLTVPLTRELLGRDQGSAEDDVAVYRLGDRCRRFGRRRVDCEIRDEDSCEGVASVSLGRTGVVLRRHYGCRRPRFRRNPRFITVGRGVGVQRLSRLDGGYWEESV
jgi:hypothetical protein